MTSVIGGKSTTNLFIFYIIWQAVGYAFSLTAQSEPIMKTETTFSSKSYSRCRPDAVKLQNGQKNITHGLHFEDF